MNTAMCSLLAVLALVASVSAETLDEAAARIEQRLEDVFLDTNGVMRCSTGASDVTIWESKGPYENVGIVQGFLLQALCAKYAVTHAECDLRKARRTYEAIVKVYDLSQPAGEGYFCKPWGWQLRDETSSDQFVDAMLGMDAFYNFATPAERAAIADRIPKMARWWIRRNYNWQYLGRPLKWQRCRFLTFSALAEKYAKSGEFAAELKRLLADPAVTNDLPYRCGIERGRYHGPNNKIFYKVSPGTAEIGFNAVSAVLDADPENAYANKVMESCYDLASTCIQPDGSAIVNFVRTADGQWREMSPEDAFMERPSSSDPRFNSPLLRFHGPVRVSAVGAVQGLAIISEYYPPAKAWMDLHGEEILLAMAQRGFARTDPYGIEPESVKEMLARFPDHCESDCAWLHAYWLWRLHQTGRTMRGRGSWQMFDRRLGMFIHWGIYAVDGWHEQARMRKAMSREEYAKLAQGFTAEKFDANHFVDVAQSAGADYIVFTTKHHDGFCLWNTKTTDFNVMKTPCGRDVLKELSEACRRRGVKLGLYYSNPDWNHPNAYNEKSSHQLAAPNPGDLPDMSKYVEYVKAQITELMTNYGEICCLFWDIPTKVSVPELNELVRHLQPNIKIDDRGWGSKGDYSTPERGVENDEAFTRLTEACDSVGAESWGYRVNEDYHTHGYLTRAIDRTLARGGNLLLNVGPKADGTIPAESVDIMRKVGAWLAKMRESYDGVTLEPNAAMGNVVTRRGNTVYVHCPKGVTASGLNLAPLDAEPRRVTLLNDGRDLPFKVEYMPSSFWSTKQPSLHVWKIPADKFADEAIVLKLEYESLGRLKGNTIMVPGPEHAKSLRRHTGIPSVAVSPKNGRLWVSFYTGITPGEDSNNYCVLATSGDGGKTWQEVLVADPDGEGPYRAFDPQVWVAPDGKLRWTWTERLAPLAKTTKDTYAGGKADPKEDRLRAVTLSAEDLPPEALPAMRTLGRGVMMEKPIVTREGTWLYPVSYWFAAPSSVVLASADGGCSYAVRGGATLPKSLRQFDEQSLVQLKDGRLAVFMRTEGTNGIWRAESADGGRTWSESRFSGICHVASRPFVRRLKSGNLLLVKHGRPDEVTKGRCRLMAFLSRDDGKTWEGGLLLDERTGVSYPDGDQASDGLIRLVYDHDRVTAQEILLATFAEEDVLAGHLVSGKAMLKQVIVQGGR